MKGHVCIVGAGVVGCASAYALARAGWRVTLIDAHDRPGLGTTYANGGQLSYSHVEPLATPDALKALPGWLLSPDSPLRWRPRLQVEHWQWLARFVAACRWPRVQRTTRELLALSFLSRDTLHAWFAEQPADWRAATLHARPGKLVLYRKPAAREAVARQLAWQAEAGCEQRIVEADECVDLEPALAATGGGPIAFAVWTPGEEVVDASLLAQGLARASGCALRLGRPVQAIETRAGRALGVRIDGELLAADHVIVAAGLASVPLLRPLGIRAPLEPIKGYSVTLALREPAQAPRVSLTDTARKLVHARLGERLRVAGFAELMGETGDIPQRRIQALCDAVKATFPGACDFTDPRAWTGLRPATPSGVPVVGASLVRGLWLNLGHGSLGLTLAAGSAALLASQMAGAAPPISAEPYRP